MSVILVCLAIVFIMLGMYFTAGDHLALTVIMCIFCMACVCGVLFYYLPRIFSIKEHNQLCDQQLREWDHAWDHWEETILSHALQEDANGSHRRLFEAVIACLEEMNEEIFGLSGRREEIERIEQSEIEEVVRRKRVV